MSAINLQQEDEELTFIRLGERLALLASLDEKLVEAKDYFAKNSFKDDPEDYDLFLAELGSNSLDLRLAFLLSDEHLVSRQALMAMERTPYCKNPLLEEYWLPDWIRQKRDPSFVTGTDSANWLAAAHPLGLGQTAWGAMPAMDVVNLSKNENDSDRDLDLAFAASGDLRSVIKTINSLPGEYNGKLTILMNDKDPLVLVRIMVLLTLLSKPADLARNACDVALHLWYSAFIPAGYETIFQVILNDMIMERLQDSEEGDAKLIPGHTTMSRPEPPENVRDTSQYVLLSSHTNNYDYDDAKQEYLNVRLDNDLADPIRTWDPVEVIAAGQAHGAPASDTYGCFYFFMTDQLREFSDRLQRFHVDFKLSNMGLLEFSRNLQAGKFAATGLHMLATQQFDRIEANNTIDPYYGGLQAVLTAWGPLLKPTPFATLLGYSMNWAGDDRNGARPAGKSLSRIIQKMKADGNIPNPDSWSRLGLPKDKVDGSLRLSLAYNDAFTVEYDNSGAFETYLEKQGIKQILRDGGLQRKTVHTIVSPRCYSPLEAPFSALPEFKDPEEYYLRASLQVLFQICVTAC
ncbi:hypothetical protein CYLTODRAFT_448385 [Cylindrobasidium torrendii FP15055 ss-10]|uniref:DUF4470 domain-containing protein n=1 Tax=Cylindrobasidium torrendii FP15055 ss-10 TaxID=1314674 RepID=A0A0D7BX31_9AGAR|nr:hypothetical protein CYLTODRAFT_448385 [Cylindrobasidium torrendii FP15055 ss-10]